MKSTGAVQVTARESETSCQRSVYCAAGFNDRLSTARNGGGERGGINHPPSPPTTVYRAACTRVRV